ncbi:MAG: epimerase [Hyphomonas sp.]|uniref:NAD-dependent epimerase/dehydratase family protein n=1 Tax=Hyphomonas sp. TaxID=87 RepID=UPI0025B8CF97|nr:NAD-dependent epimerase/dehydratase family protein [Hyphomonas sp.]MBA4339897.1 epimerase [Hyphomonas sp.]
MRVLVTGASGFIAKHVVLAALAEGHTVRGTVRTVRKADILKTTLAAEGADVSRLSLVEADLTADAGWADAMSSVDAVLHVASPFPISQPKGREDLVPAARGGALRVVKAALDADIKRIVLTSSMVAMMYRAGLSGDVTFREDSWSDPEWAPATPYIISKTRAERAVWDLAKERGATDAIVAINPGFVLGPALDAEIGASLEVIKLFMTGAYPAVPPVHFPVVDVRDLAALHIKALTAPVGGRRLIGSGETISMQDMAKILRADLPDRAKKIPTGVLPKEVVRLIALFDPTLKTVLADLYARPVADAAYVSELTGVTFRPARDAVVAAGRSLIATGAV